MARKPLHDEAIESSKDITLYHVTPYANKILSGGFKARRELGITGLGGADTGDFISFTTSPVIARDIMRDIETVSLIKKGEITADNMAEMLDKRDFEDEPYYKQTMTERPSKIWKERLKTYRTEINKLSEEKKMEMLLDVYTSYLYHREEVNGRKNPLFINIEDAPFGKSDIDIGIISTQITLPPIKIKEGNDWEYKIVEKDPTLANLWKNFESAYDEYKTAYHDDQKPYRTPNIRTGDNFLREIKLNLSLIPCKKSNGSCQNFSRFDPNKIAKDDYNIKKKEDNDLTYYKVSGDFERGVCSKIAKEIMERYNAHKEGWSWGLSNSKEKYPIHVDYVLRDKPHLDEILPEIESECEERYPKGVCKRMFKEFFEKEKKCQGY